MLSGCLLPAVCCLLSPACCLLPQWAFMWLLAFAIFVGCKWLTWCTAPRGASGWLQLGYLMAWPGLDACTFLITPNRLLPPMGAWLFAAGKLALGMVLIWGVYPRLTMANDLMRGWVGMIGILFVLHLGLFHLLSLGWKSVGVSAKPLMNWPILTTGVGEFWGRRWNTAFRDLTHRFLFRPLTARFGARIALFVGFLFSGIVHDLVISLPARGGYGGPTVFFLVQAGAIFLERSTLGRRLGLARGLRGWAFAMLVLVGPICLLFHPSFVCGIVVPFVDWITQERSAR